MNITRLETTGFPYVKSEVEDAASEVANRQTQKSLQQQCRETRAEIPGVYYRRSTQRWIAGWHFRGVRYWKNFAPNQFKDARERAVAIRREVERLKTKYEQEGPQALTEQEMFTLTNGHLNGTTTLKRRIR